MRTKGKQALTVSVSNDASYWQQRANAIRPGTTRMQGMKNPESYMPDETAIAEVRRHIDMYNVERPGIYRNCTVSAWLAMGAYAVFVLIVIYGALQMRDGKSMLGAILVFGVVGGVWVWRQVWKPLRDRQLGLRYLLFPKVFAFIEEVRYSAGIEPYFLDDLKRLKLVDFTKSKNDDVISGMHEGMKFELVETELIRGSGKSERTTFKGLIFQFALAEAFPGLLVASKRGSWWERTMKEFWGTGPFNDIRSGNLRLDETHEFRTSNHTAAQPVIAGPLTSVLTWLGNEWHGGDVRIALSHDQGYLMLPTTTDYFALPDLQRDVSYEGHVKPLVREMVQLLAVAHVVRKVG